MSDSSPDFNKNRFILRAWFTLKKWITLAEREEFNHKVREEFAIKLAEKIIKDNIIKIYPVWDGWEEVEMFGACYIIQDKDIESFIQRLK